MSLKEKFLSSVEPLNREFNKIIWPSKKEVIGGGRVVVLCVFFVSLVLSVLDYIFFKFMKYIF